MNSGSLVGLRFGRLVVIKKFSDSAKHGPIWECKCDCGTSKKINGYVLIYGKSKSCGCLQRELSSIRMKKHGMKGTRTYKIWEAMKHRCCSEKDISYSRYGGRGIKICKRWINDFSSFLEDMGEAREGMSIDRIDNDGDYEASNCSIS